MSESTESSMSDSTTSTTSQDDVDVVSLETAFNNSELVSKVVAHRGYHSKFGRSRPIENTLSAFEQVWEAGVVHCECDVQITKDQVLVISHDESIERLAMDPDHPHSKTEICDLEYKQVVNMKLSDGSGVPRLDEVLESAIRIGSHARLVVEIKPVPSAKQTANVLLDFLCAHPRLRARVVIVMSFDIHVIKHYATLQSAKLEADADADAQDISEQMHEADLTSVNTEEENIPVPVDASRIPHPLVMLLAGHAGAVGAPHWATLVDYSKLHSDPLMARELLQVGEKGFSLDGLYLRYVEEMMDNGSGQEAFRLACQAYHVGVWMKDQDPDTLSVTSQLIECGAKYVNSDFELSSVPTSSSSD